MSKGLVADMSQGTVVIYQGEVKDFGVLLEEGSEMVDPDNE